MYPTPARHPSAAVSGCLGFLARRMYHPYNIRVKSATNLKYSLLPSLNGNYLPPI